MQLASLMSDSLERGFLFHHHVVRVCCDHHVRAKQDRRAQNGDAINSRGLSERGKDGASQLIPSTSHTRPSYVRHVRSHHTDAREYLFKPDENGRKGGNMDRRAFLTTSAAAGAMLATTGGAIAETERPAGETGVVLPTSSEAKLPLGVLPNTRYPDTHIESLDKRFKGSVGTGAVERVATGFRWAEGPAYCAAGRYLIFSDIPNNRMMRVLEDDNHLSVFRTPSYNSNGNTFDTEGRLVSCEHAGRRIVRTEHDGTVTVVADRYNGKRINSPNDVVVASNGSIWFCDPTYGADGNYEGFKVEKEQEKHNVFRVDPQSGAVTVVVDDFVHHPWWSCPYPVIRRRYRHRQSDQREGFCRRLCTWIDRWHQVRCRRQYLVQHGLGRSEGRWCPLLPLQWRPDRQNSFARNLCQHDFRWNAA
jgi:SMP-30/gluconolaconase/LRE-like protein